jgi:pyrroloquinoline quinone biosynthesis protein D
MSTNESQPAHTDTFMGRDLDEEYLFYDQKGDQVHVLNGTARDIYLLCDGSRKPADIAMNIVREYDVEPEQAMTDVLETITSLTKLGLLKTD